MYQVDPPAVDLDASGVAIPLLDPPISEEPPTLAGLRKAITGLEDARAADTFGIPANLLKAGGEPVAWGLRTVLATIWQSGSIPPDLLRGAAIPLEREG